MKHTSIIHRPGFKPDYREFLTMVKGEKPSRPVFYEHYIEWPTIWEALGNDRVPQDSPPWGWCLNIAKAHAKMGYDVAPFGLNLLLDFHFAELDDHGEAKSISQNTSSLIETLKDVESYPWPDVDKLNVGTMLDDFAEELPEGMKLLLYAPRSVFETLVDILGFENMSLLFYDEPEIIQAICKKVGERIAPYFEKFVGHDIFCASFNSDDLGHKTAPFISPDSIRETILPWHKKFVEATHQHKKIAILHSCGKVEGLMDDIIDFCKYDAKHSFEDVICPVENIYEQFGDRIAILGGLDVDFMTRSTPEKVEKRALELLQRTQCKRYALGTGNSITSATPLENVAALARAAEQAEKTW